MTLFEKRISAVRDLLRESNVDVLVVTSWDNLYYLTGMRPIQYWEHETVPMPLLISAHEYDTTFVPTAAFSMAVEREHKHIRKLRPFDGPNLWAIVGEVLSEWTVRSVGLEYRNLTKFNAEKLAEHATDAKFVDMSDVVENLRTIKDEEEISYIKTACHITDKVVETVADGYLKPGKTEADIARDIIALTVEYGAENVSFQPQVFSGRRGNYLNVSSSESKIIRKGEVVLLDFGAIYRGYRTDITRPFVLGKAKAKHQRIAGKVSKILNETIQFIKAGVTASDIHKFALSKFEEVGYGGRCRQYSGHGIGLSASEKPVLREYDNTVIEPGMTLAVEHGLYFSDFGLRLEENVIVGRQGVKRMFKSPLGLVEV